jgi:hypothetical protein
MSWNITPGPLYSYIVASNMLGTVMDLQKFSLILFRKCMPHSYWNTDAFYGFLLMRCIS